MESPEALTAEKLRKELFVSFRSRGILGAMKSQLRSALLQHLRDEDGSLFDASKKGTPPLQDRVLASTFVEYLEAYGFSFSQSVFVPESRMDVWPPFSHDELAHILRLDLAPISSEPSGRRTCLLQKLINIVQHFLTSVKKQDVSTQTEDHPKKLDGWLKEIDEAFRRKLEIEKMNSSQTLEERISKLYQDFDNQVRAEVDAQVSKIREFEIAQVRMEEAANYHRHLASARKDHDDMQKALREQVSQKEAAFMERMHAKQKEVELIAYQQRQQVLENAEDIRARSDKLKQEMEMQEKALQQREEAVKTREMHVKIQEDDVNHLREFLHSQADEILTLRKNQLEKDYQSLQNKLLLERSALEAEQMQLREDKRAFSADAASARTDRELVQALYRRLSTEESQRKSLLSRINELEEQLKASAPAS